MKRFWILFLAAVLLLGLAACGGTNTRNAEISLGESRRFSAAERQAAADLVLREFKNGYGGCTLKKIYYDEVESVKLAGSYIDQPQSEIYGMNPDDIIVLFSDFHTGIDSGS